MVSFGISREEQKHRKLGHLSVVAYVIRIGSSLVVVEWRQLWWVLINKDDDRRQQQQQQQQPQQRRQVSLAYELVEEEGGMTNVRNLHYILMECISQGLLQLTAPEAHSLLIYIHWAATPGMSYWSNRSSLERRLERVIEG